MRRGGTTACRVVHDPTAPSASSTLPGRTSSCRSPPARPSNTRRVRLPGPPPAYAVAANGGVLLVDGAPTRLARHVRRRAGGRGAPRRGRGSPGARPADVDDQAAQRRETCSATRSSSAPVPADSSPRSRRGAPSAAGGCPCRAASCTPCRALTKAAAVAEIARRRRRPVFAAGDSLLDADASRSPTRRSAPRRGSWPRPGFTRDHLTVTDTTGRAGRRRDAGVDARPRSDYEERTTPSWRCGTS